MTPNKAIPFGDGRSLLARWRDEKPLAWWAAASAACAACLAAVPNLLVFLDFSLVDTLPLLAFLLLFAFLATFGVVFNSSVLESSRGSLSLLGFLIQVVEMLGPVLCFAVAVKRGWLALQDGGDGSGRLRIDQL